MSLHLPGGTRLVQNFIDGGMVPKGPWDSETVYSIGDSVDYYESSYILYADAIAGTLPTDTDYWQVLAHKGDTGDKGDKGDKGDTGDTGEGLVEGWLYLPSSASKDVDGCWRVGLDGNNLVMQRRESGNWIEKAAATP